MKTPFSWTRVYAFALVAGLTVVPAVTPAGAQATTATYNNTSGLAMQSIDEQGHTVVVFQGSGDLPGVLTLVLTVAADGSVTGEWAMNVSYTAPLHPDAQPDPSSDDPDSAQGEQLIQKGMLHGTITSGSVQIANGQVTELDSLSLNIVAGSMQYAAVTKGAGTVNAIHVDDRATSTAYLALTF